jgi:glutathione-regulated potassium-efflux system ancillary protein KefC
MEALWIGIAFVFGFSAKQINLPPMVGYLIAGFVLNSQNIKPIQALPELSHFGVIILLFTIGLKLDVKKLLQPLVLFTSLIHIFATSAVFSIILFAIGYVTTSSLFDLSWQQAVLISFAFSFSSTVCAIKILQDRGEISSRHGNITIGILVIQDIVAVIFLTLASKKIPSVWALGLLALPLAKKPLFFILNRAGHDELLCLTGFFIAFLGVWIFDSVGINEELGALLLGTLIAQHPKSSELYKSLINFKEIFLIAFFLSIGFSSKITWPLFMIASSITFLVIFKGILFVFLLMFFKARARTALLSMIALFNYSEFSLIVAQICVERRWLDAEWLVIVALSVSISFVISSIMNNRAHYYFKLLKSLIIKFEFKEVLPEDKHFNTGKIDVIIVGMGNIGANAYEALSQIYEGKICGIDTNQSKVEMQLEKGYKVILGDGTNLQFWENQKFIGYKLVMLALSSVQDNLEVTRQLLDRGYKGKIAAISLFHDEEDVLKEAGVHMVFNYQTEVGMGYANHALAEMQKEA